MKLYLYLEGFVSGLKKVATHDITLGIGGTIAGSMIAGHLLKDPYQKDKDRVEKYEKNKGAYEQDVAQKEDARRREVIRNYLAKKQGQVPQHEGLMRIISVGGRGLSNGYNAMKKVGGHPVTKGLGFMGVGAAFTGMDRMANYATMKKDRALSLKAAKYDLEKEEGEDKAKKISDRADQRAKEGKHYDDLEDYKEGVLPPKNWYSMGKNLARVEDEDGESLEKKRGNYSRQTNGYDPEHNPQTHSGYTDLPGADHIGVSR